jgi:hypothetical protein
LLQTPRRDDGDGFLVDAGIVKLARWQIAGSPVGGDGGDEDNLIVILSYDILMLMLMVMMMTSIFCDGKYDDDEDYKADAYRFKPLV